MRIARLKRKQILKQTLPERWSLVFRGSLHGFMNTKKVLHEAPILFRLIFWQKLRSLVSRLFQQGLKNLFLKNWPATPAGFYAQQAVEKCLKAVVAFYSIKFRIFHDPPPQPSKTFRPENDF
jgi:hypothetical protein